MDVTADFSTLNLTSNATVTLDGAVTAGSLVFGDTTPNYNWFLNNGTGGPLTLAASPSYVPSITVSNQTATISASLTGLQGLVKNGSGTLVLNGVNTFLGNTTINGGVLEVSINSCLYYAWNSFQPANFVTINPGATLQLDGWYGYSGQTYGGDINQSDESNPNGLTINGGALKFGGSWTGTSSRAFAIGTNGATLLNGSPNSSAWNFSLGGNSVQDTVINNSSLTLDGVGFSSLSKTLTGTGSLTKNGSGTWTLTGTNTYTGGTTVNAGCLALGSGGSISNTPSICVAGGAVFDVTGLSSFTLGTGQTLSNSTSTATVVGNLNTGAGIVALTYAAGTPSLQITNGTFTLSTNTVFSVNNTGTNLIPGSYKLIAKGNGGLVAGTVPATFSMGGGGASSGFALQIIGGELYLNNTNIWLPATLGTNLVNWYDASDISTLWQNTAGTTAVTANGQTVLRWNDKSGNGNHLTISSGGPAYTTGVMNSLPVVYFNGNKLANLAASMGNMTNNFTVIGVIQVTSNSGWDNWITWGNGNVGGGDLLVYVDSSARTTTPAQAVEFAYNGGTGAATTNAVTSQAAFLFISGVNQATNPNQFSVWMNGGFQEALVPTGVLHSGSSLTQFRIGPSGTSQLPHGNIAELIIVNTGTNTLSNGKRQQIEGYLANKWWGSGTNNPLPLNHPYKNSVPLIVPPTPVLPPNGVSVAGGVVSLNFPTVSGYQYRVDYKNALTDLAWQIVAPGFVTSTNSANLTVTDSTAPTQGSRFYRVEAVSP
jgi:autotransporter-associated beta strand protein